MEKRSLKAAAFLMASVVGATFGASASTAASDPQAPYLRPHRLIQIAPGRHLDLYCIGSGSPVVIFDYGLGGPPTTWLSVQPAIGQLTTACTYDRAGYGFSSPGPLPRDTQSLVSDLHALLHASGLKGPYIFVGHSLGGMDGNLFADKYLGELAGMVLVDPAVAGQNEAFATIPGVREILEKAQPNFDECIRVARSGKHPTAHQVANDCLDQDPTDSASDKAVKDSWAMDANHWESMRSELQSMEPEGPLGDLDFQEAKASNKSWGNLPLIVLTSGDKMTDSFPVGMRKPMATLWMSRHNELAHRSSRGRNMRVPDTGHYIQLEQPDVVIQAIKEVLATARKDAKSGH